MQAVKKGLQPTFHHFEFVLLNQATEDKFQITSITSNVLIVTKVYRSTGATHFLNTFTNFIQDYSKAHIVMRDMNVCQRNNTKSFSH